MKRQPLFMSSLYPLSPIYLSGCLVSLPFLKGNSLQYQLLTFMFWRNLPQIISISKLLAFLHRQFQAVR